MTFLRRTITVKLGLLILAPFLVLIIVLAWALIAQPAPSIDPARIRTACAQYAGLDLSGLATICRDAGYQETM